MTRAKGTGFCPAEKSSLPLELISGSMERLLNTSTWCALGYAESQQTNLQLNLRVRDKKGGIIMFIITQDRQCVVDYSKVVLIYVDGKKLKCQDVAGEVSWLGEFHSHEQAEVELDLLLNSLLASDKIYHVSEDKVEEEEED